MRLRSLADLDIDRAWRHVLSWARGDVMDVPDRLPYELADRVWDGQPRLQREHEVQPVHLVMATKVGLQTIRPFVRPHVRDMLLYQALVDELRDPIEAALPDRQTLFSYRLTAGTSDDAFAGTPQWRDFHEASMVGVAENPDVYVIGGDLSSFFLTVDLSRLRRELLDIGGNRAVVRDLYDLLQAWDEQGVRGLPQELPPSGPLANIYLQRLDEILGAGAVDFWRYSDDFIALTQTFGTARLLLDVLERELYERGMSLGSGKTSIKRAATVLGELTTFEDELDEALASLLADAGGDYEPPKSQVDDAKLELLKGAFDDAIEALRQDLYPRRELIASLRGFASRRDGHAVTQVPYMMQRMPGLTSACMQYLAKLRAPERPAVIEALAEVIDQPFHRDQEWVHILRACLHVPDRGLGESADRFAELARGSDAPLVRARALLAWSRRALPSVRAPLEAFFEAESLMWRGYAVASLKGRSSTIRDQLSAHWSRQSKTIDELIQALDDRPLRWSVM